MRAAAAGLRSPDQPSAARLGALIARRVIGDVMREIDADPGDFLTISRALAATLAPDPFTRLVTDPEIDTASIIRAARLARFESRGCRHLSELEIRTENRAVAHDAARALARRYARYLRD